jgi:hypothetical protein
MGRIEQLSVTPVDRSQRTKLRLKDKWSISYLEIQVNRRDWLKKAAIIASGVVAADQLEILDRLGWTRTLFPAASLAPKFIHKSFVMGFELTQEILEDDYYFLKGETYEEELSIWTQQGKDRADRALIEMLKEDMKDYKSIRPNYPE